MDGLRIEETLFGLYGGDDNALIMKVTDYGC